MVVMKSGFLDSRRYSRVAGSGDPRRARAARPCQEGWRWRTLIRRASREKRIGNRGHFLPPVFLPAGSAFFSILAQVSRRETARLKTMAPGLESGSTAK